MPTSMPGGATADGTDERPPSRRAVRVPRVVSAQGWVVGVKCPTDPAHGSLIPLTGGTGDWGWFCPHQDHDGFKDRPASRAFFRTSEVDVPTTRRASGASSPEVRPVAANGMSAAAAP